MCVFGMTRVLELPVLNGKRRSDRHRLDDGRGLDPIGVPLTSVQLLLRLTCLLTVCTIGELFWSRAS